MNFKYLISAISICLSTLTFNASAAIISTDWLAADDNLITYDTTSGLEWLDLTATVNRSLNDVGSKFGAGEEFDGWRYATRTEVSSFFDAFGGNNNYYNNYGTTENNGLFDAIAPLWGDLYCEFNACAVGEGYSEFLTGDLVSGGPLYWFSFISDYEVDVDSATQDIVYLDWGNGNGDYQRSTTGSALVRVSAVPVPAAVWLFGSGLLGLISVASRKKV